MKVNELLFDNVVEEKIYGIFFENIFFCNIFLIVCGIIINVKVLLFFLF